MGKKFNGAISIFMIIITMSCFMFGGIFIDAARVLAAKNKINSAMATAARSAMASYDANLSTEYGLYAVENDKLNENFKKYFTVNMQRSNFEGINMFQYTIDDADITMSGTDRLSNNLNKQIVQYEKYRAPVNMTISVIERITEAIKSIFGKASKAKKSSDAVDELKQQAKSSKQVLSASKDTITKNIKNQLKSAATTAVSDFLSNEVKSVGEIISGLRATTDSKISEVKNEIEKQKAELQKLKEKKAAYDNQSNSLETDNDYLEDKVEKGENAEADAEANKQSEEQKKLERQISDLETTINKEESEINTIKSNLETKTQALKNAMDAKRSADEALKKAESNLTQKKDELKISEKEKEQYEAAAALGNLDNSLNEFFNGLVLTDEEKKDYADYKDALAKDDLKTQRDLLEKYNENENILTLYQSYKAVLDAEQNVNTAKRNVDSAKGQIDALQREVDSCKQRVEDCKNEVERKRDDFNGEVEKLNNMSVPTFADVTLGNLSSTVKTVVDEDDNIISSAKSLVEQITATMPGIEGDPPDEDNESGIIKLFNKLYDKIEGIVEIVNGADSLLDKMYRIDYVMTKCTFLTSQTERDHHFNVGEVEYILEGYTSQSANIIAVVGEIWLIRFSIDAICYMAKAPTPGFLSRAAYGITRGAAQATIDIGELITKNEGCSLCPLNAFKEIKLSYSDHLRLLLLMNSSADFEKRLEKTINATMTNNLDAPGTDKLYVSGKAVVSAKVNLIMIPMFTDLLPTNKFENGNIRINSEMSLSY